MNDIPLKQIIDSTLSQIGSVADVNTVIGDPITTAEGTTIIPFSKVPVGYASGGADYDGKKENSDGNKNVHFAGGNGAGVSVTPLGFLVINKDGTVHMLDLKHPETFEAPADPVSKTLNSVNGIIEKAPEIVNKIKDAIAKRKEAKKNAEAKAEESEETAK